MAKSRLSAKIKSVATNARAERVAKHLAPKALLAFLRKPKTLGAIRLWSGANDAEVQAALNELRERGSLIDKFGDAWGIARAPQQIPHAMYPSRADGTYLFGFCSDTHLGSKYERLDVLNSLYDRFAAAGVDCVFHAGNWIDGEASFNQRDLAVHGMDAQLAHLVKHYPRRKGLITHAIAGADHEGWYAQREGVDIGRHAARVMRDAGRNDWTDLGYMEAFVRLKHARTGCVSQLLVMHPGGGSAYAHSYKPQKIVESFAGGEKPAVVLIGHYHKLSQNLIRNVWAIQAGCTQDQTVFMRKKGIDAHLGGGICKLTQDRSGAIVGCQVEFFAYYNRGYYNGRWSHSGSVTRADRGV